MHEQAVCTRPFLLLLKGPGDEANSAVDQTCIYFSKEKYYLRVFIFSVEVFITLVMQTIFPFLVRVFSSV